MPLEILEKLAANPSLFEGCKIVVAGDIAYDRSYRCRAPAPGFHATHGAETIFDLEPGGDDGGAVGSANNICLFCASLGAGPSLWTATGDDEEGRRVAEILASQHNPAHIFRLPEVRTVTRLRFFVRDDTERRYRLAFRIDSEPDYVAAAEKSAALAASGTFVQDFESDLRDADALILNDTEKGLLCPPVVGLLGVVVERVQQERLRSARRPLTVVVDPKFDWNKFGRLPVDAIKPNLREAARAAGLAGITIDPGNDADLFRLGRSLSERFGQKFPQMVVTLGRAGAAFLESSGGYWVLYRYPSFPSNQNCFETSTHCGDVFGAALALGLTQGEGWPAAITFANAVAALQYSRPTSIRVTRTELLAPTALEQFRAHDQPASLVAEWKS